MGLVIVTVIIVVVFLLIACGIGLGIYSNIQEKRRIEAERQANRKPCARCRQIHYNKGDYCTDCVIEWYKKEKGMR